MTPDPEPHIYKYLCEKCKFFERYKLDYHIVNAEGKIIAKKIQSPFGKCRIFEKSIEGREHICKKFKIVEDN